MDTQSVIVAVASPPGAALRGVVRASGAGALALAARVAAPRRDGATIQSRGVHLGRLRDPLPACPCLVVSMPGPASSTGEDVVELHLAGNPILLERVAAALVLEGAPHARRAGPGEFSVRAVLNARMTVAEAERVAAAVGAATDAQLAAANALKGDLVGVLAGQASESVATLLALVEAGIDFTDQEDVSAVAPARLAEEGAALALRVRQAAQGVVARAAEASAPIVLLAGPPNAGKSSLFNALLGRPRAVASAAAGTTRDVIEEPLALPGGGHVVLCDAPGLDHAATALDALMQAQAEAALDRADVVLWCTPARQVANPTHPGRSATDRRALPSLRAGILQVTTMCDAHEAATDNAHHLAPSGAPPHAVCTSAVTGQGLPELRMAISGAVERLAHHAGAQRSHSGSLRAELMSAAADALDAAAALARRAPRGARAMPDPELVAASLRTALDRLGEVAGAVPPDEVLGRLFARFCIGK